MDRKPEKRRPTFASRTFKKTDQWTALLQTGYTFFCEGRLEEAASLYEALVVLDSRNPYIQGLLGAIYQKQKKFDLALTRYNNALALNSSDTSALTNRGEILLKLGKFREAAQDLKNAIEMDPQKEDPAANRARLLVSIVKDAVALAQQNGVEAWGRAGRTQQKRRTGG